MSYEKNNMNFKDLLFTDENSNQWKMLLQDPFVKWVLMAFLLFALIFLSRFVLNGAVASVHAFKNLKEAIRR